MAQDLAKNSHVERVRRHAVQGIKFFNKQQRDHAHVIAACAYTGVVVIRVLPFVGPPELLVDVIDMVFSGWLFVVWSLTFAAMARETFVRHGAAPTREFWNRLHAAVHRQWDAAPPKFRAGIAAAAAVVIVLPNLWVAAAYAVLAAFIAIDHIRAPPADNVREGSGEAATPAVHARPPPPAPGQSADEVAALRAQVKDLQAHIQRDTADRGALADDLNAKDREVKRQRADIAALKAEIEELQAKIAAGVASGDDGVDGDAAATPSKQPSASVDASTSAAAFDYSPPQAAVQSQEQGAQTTTTTVDEASAQTTTHHDDVEPVGEEAAVAASPAAAASEEQQPSPAAVAAKSGRESADTASSGDGVLVEAADYDENEASKNPSKPQ